MTTWVNQHQKHSTILAEEMLGRWWHQPDADDHANSSLLSFYSVKQRHKWYLTKSAPKSLTFHVDTSNNNDNHLTAICPGQPG